MTYLCACGQLRPRPVDNSPSRGRDSMPVSNQDEALVFDSAQAGAAVLSALDVLSAQVEALELTVNDIFAILVAPLTQQERIDRVRELQGELKVARSPSTDSEPDPQPDQEVTNQ